MSFRLVIVCFIVASLIGILYVSVKRLLLSPLRSIPGPAWYALSSSRIAYDDLKGHTTRKIHIRHRKYGPVVRIGPTHVSFNSLDAMKAIYGAGSRSQRTAFYKLFEPYGRPTMFTMSSVEDHRNRKQLLARPYAKAHIIRGSIAASIEAKVDQFLNLLEKESGGAYDISELLSFFALDNATAFVFGSQNGTAALTGVEKDRAILDDYKHPARRKLSWLGVHGGSWVKASVLGSLHGPSGRDLLSSAPFSNIRGFAMQAFENYKSADHTGSLQPVEISLISQLLKQRNKSEVAPLQDIDIASECADHLLAGIETTRNLLLFLIWALSLPENERCKHKLRNELLILDDSGLNDKGYPTVEAVDKLPYLNSVLKEALRLYAPLPSSQPRFFDSDVVIDDYFIPAKTVVSISPYVLHRNPDVFKEPYEFAPERWLKDSDSEMKKWWWPFSSGGRMCTGLHLAWAEITTLVAALYRSYSTTVPVNLQHISPAITSRFEIFWDERFAEYIACHCIFTELTQD